MRTFIFMLMVLLSGWTWAVPSREPGSCEQDQADICIDATPCKRLGDQTVCLANAPSPPVGALILASNCWQYRAAFTCRASDTLSTCTPLRDRGCGQTGTSCLSVDDQGRCLSSQLTFSCPDKLATTTTTNVCDRALCQSDGLGCFDTSRPDDQDFTRAAVMMEASREAGVYGVKGEGVELFKGYMEQCSVKVLGGSSLKSCCSAAGGGGAFTNYHVIGLAADAAYAVGKEELKAGSKYLYDALFTAQDGSLMNSGLAAASGGLSPGAATGVAAQAGTNFGAYGFSFSYSSAGGFQFVGFDPTTFAIAIAMQIITEWLSCGQDEQILQMKNGQSLCTYIETYCSSRVLGVCVERKQRHCCFNSVLAKLINRQGRAQLGLPQEQCGGLSQEQLAALDFSRMDLSEFIASISPRQINAEEEVARMRDSINRRSQQGEGSYYEQ